jgi:hypothetical protein
LLDKPFLHCVLIPVQKLGRHDCWSSCLAGQRVPWECLGGISRTADCLWKCSTLESSDDRNPDVDMGNVASKTECSPRQCKTVTGRKGAQTTRKRVVIHLRRLDLP